MTRARMLTGSLIAVTITFTAVAGAQTRYVVTKAGEAEILKISVPSSVEPAHRFDITVSATAQQDQIDAIEVYENGFSVAKINGTPPFTLSFPPHAAGRYEYQARAINKHGRQIGIAVPVWLQVAAPVVAGAIPPVPPPPPPPPAKWNGIGVGPAKAFDDRALLAMLRDVEMSLAARFIDPAAVHAAVGRFQGTSATTTSFGLSATTLPLPSTEQTSELQTVSAIPTSTTSVEDGVTTVTDLGATQETTDKTTNKVTQGGVSPVTAPTLAPSALFSFAAPFGVAASDLLAEQTELTYQALNLRILLQRSISDKALIEPGPEGVRLDHRLQVVLGFQVSIDPPAQWRHRRAVAEVIVRITPDGTNRRGDAPSLVALLPREKTYNVATVRRGSSAFNLGAIVQPLNIGASFARSRETLYLVKDTDTVAFERRPEVRNSLEFAWQFRPVLDQASVTPGVRQMFAVLSFPAGVAEQWKGRVEVKTHWRDYNKRRKVVGEAFVSTVNDYDPYTLKVDSTIDQALALSPKTESIYWEDAGGGNVVVTLGGRFPIGTRVAAGDRLLQNGSPGLVLDSQRRLTFVVPASTLFLGDLALVDSFGESRAVLYERATQASTRSGDLPEEGYTSVTASATAAGIDQANVRVCIAPALNLFDHRPLFRIGETVFGLRETPAHIEQVQADKLPPKDVKFCDLQKADNVLIATFKAPLALVTGKPSIHVIDPFWGDRYVTAKSLKLEQDPNAILASGVKILSIGEQATLGITGDNLNDDSLKVFLGDAEQTEFKLRTPSLVTFSVDRKKIAQLRHVIVKSRKTATQPEEATAEMHQRRAKPGKEAQADDPKDVRVALLRIPLSELARPHVLRYSPVVQGQQDVITIEGGDLFAIREIRFGDEKLIFNPDPHAANTIVHVRPSVALTRLQGQKELTIVAEDGSVQTFMIFVREAARG